MRAAHGSCRMCKRAGNGRAKPNSLCACYQISTAARHLRAVSGARSGVTSFYKSTGGCSSLQIVLAMRQALFPEAQKTTESAARDD